MDLAAQSRAWRPGQALFPSAVIRESILGCGRRFQASRRSEPGPDFLAALSFRGVRAQYCGFDRDVRAGGVASSAAFEVFRTDRKPPRRKRDLLPGSRDRAHKAAARCSGSRSQYCVSKVVREGRNAGSDRAVHDYLRSNLDRKITIDELALRFHINTTTLKKEFKLVYGTSVAAHIRKHRMEEASRLLRTTNMSISLIAAAVGYESQSRFSLVFKEEYGMLPTAYRSAAVNAEDALDGNWKASRSGEDVII